MVRGSGGLGDLEGLEGLGVARGGLHSSQGLIPSFPMHEKPRIVHSPGPLTCRRVRGGAFDEGDVFLMADQPDVGAALLAMSPLPPLPAGSFWGPVPAEDAAPRPWLQILGWSLLPLRHPHACNGWWCRCLDPSPFFHEAQVTGALWKTGFSLAWITLSDKGHAGQREDKGGPLVEEVARAGLPIGHAQGFLLPDDPQALKALLMDLALQQRYDLICTTGGTGLAPRDQTPEATLAVIERRLHGFEQLMMQTSLAKTATGCVSRAVAGTLGSAILVNLPGSPKAIRENLAALVPALAHAIEKLQGDPRDCGT